MITSQLADPALLLSEGNHNSTFPGFTAEMLAFEVQFICDFVTARKGRV